MARILVTGITGMDGSILAERLLDQGHKVFGLVRRSATSNLSRIEHLLDHPDLSLIDGDITSQESIFRAIEKAEPSSIFHLAAQSYVPYSFSAPVNTFETTAIGTINVLEAIRNIDTSIRFYQASSSEMFGKVLQTPQTENTPFYPRSPYGVAKAAAHYATINYRESFGIFASSGILFNHEHERRGASFVSKKVTQGVAKALAHYSQGENFDPISLGNLEAKRDWGYAEDYVEAMQMIMDHTEPDTFVIATGIARSVRTLCEEAVSSALALLNLSAEKIQWKGQDAAETGWLGDSLLFKVSKEFYRPAEVDILLGSAEKAKKILGWEPKTPFSAMIRTMVDYDLKTESGRLAIR